MSGDDLHHHGDERKNLHHHDRNRTGRGRGALVVMMVTCFRPLLLTRRAFQSCLSNTHHHHHHYSISVALEAVCSVVVSSGDEGAAW